MNIDVFDARHEMKDSMKSSVASFLHEHLGEYGDDLSAIEKAMDYALSDEPGFGGFIVVARTDNEIIGATVINETGMEEYIPENILVYIATHEGYRGQGIGKKLMKKAIDQSDGGIALHVEPDNPAIHLYRKMGFEKKYVEMRRPDKD